MDITKQIGYYHSILIYVTITIFNGFKIWHWRRKGRTKDQVWEEREEAKPKQYRKS